MGPEDHPTRGQITDAELRRLVDTAVNPFCLIDATGQVLWASDSISEVLQRSASELVGTSMLDYVAPRSLEDALLSLAAADEYVAERGSRAAEGWDGLGPVIGVARPDGTEISCSVAVATPLRTGLDFFVLQLRRADAAYALEDALIAISEGRTMVEVMSQVAAMLEGELPSADVAIFHRPAPDEDLEAIVGPKVLAEVLLDESILLGTGWLEAMANPGAVIELPVSELPSPWRGVAAAQGYQWLALHAVPPTASSTRTDSAALLAIWSGHDFAMHVFTHQRVRRGASLVGLVGQWERGRRALEWEATHDALTKLYNRSALFHELSELHPSESAALLYLDLDDFKPINDEHGHNVGDSVLAEVAVRLLRAVRPTDTVARLGGDEFAIICRRVDQTDPAEAMAQRLVAEVTKPMVVDGLAVQVGLSVGLAHLEPGDEADAVLVRADAALRRAKVDGKQRWRRSDDPVLPLFDAEADAEADATDTQRA